MIWLSLALARPPTGQTQVVVVMKNAGCPVCVEQLTRLREARLPANLMGITHESSEAAAVASQQTGVSVYSHAPGIRSMGLLRDGYALPAVVVYDPCGDETGRIVGRRPGQDVTHEVRSLVVSANQATCLAKST